MLAWQIDGKESACDFDRVVWDAIRGKCAGGILHSCQDETSKHAQLLDRHSGIDYLQELPGGLRGIAVRLQWVDRSFPTYTIRSRRPSGVVTEMAKRLNSNQGFLYPHLTVQAYIAKPRGIGALLQAYVCKTTALYECVRDGKVRMQTNPIDGVEFAVVDVADITDCWAWKNVC